MQEKQGEKEIKGIHVSNELTFVRTEWNQCESYTEFSMPN
jgi:hypothetical protein